MSMSLYKLKLVDWGLGEYIDGFEGEGIDDESFQLLDKETIETIFPKSGPRLIFKKYYKIYSSDQGECSSDETSSTLSLASTSSPSMENNDLLFDLTSDDQTLDVLENSLYSQCFSIPQSPDKRKSASSSPEPSTPKILRITSSVFPKGLEEILKKYTDGQICLANKLKLNNDNRQKIVKVIVNELIACFGSEIRASTFLRISEEIELIFPNEKSETYYIPYVSGGKNKKGLGPKGKLWSRYVNVRAALRHANSFKKNFEDKKENANSPEQNPVESANLQFLKIAVEPYMKILEAWEQTFKLRRKLYLNANLETIYGDFPCLKLNTGIELVETDFNKRFPEQADIIYSTFSHISQAILKEAHERRIHCDIPFTDDGLRSLIILPYLFSPVTLRKNRKGENWRPTRSEIQESFFSHISNFDELANKIASRKKKLNEYGITLQPSVCVVGSGDKPDAFFILVDDTSYKVDTTIRSLELVFKLFHALDIEYPIECESVWLFIQDLIFKMKTTKKCSSSAAIITDIMYHLQDSA